MKKKNKLNETIQLINQLVDALDSAITGIEWWVENYPEGSSNADLDKIEEWKKLINKSNKVIQ